MGRHKLRVISFSPLAWSAGLIFVPVAAHGQIFVSDATSTTTEQGNIAEYPISGGSLNTPLVTGFAAYSAEWIAVSGSDLFVTNGNTIGEYSTTSGMMVRSISGFTSPTGITAYGPDLFFLSNNNTLEEYTTSGTKVSSETLSGLSDPEGIAVSGSNVFVANSGNNTIGEYTTSGGLVNASFISGLSGPNAVAVSGSDLFITNFNNGTVAEYTTGGTLVKASLISGLSNPFGIAVFGSNIFVSNFEGQSIGEYTTSGTLEFASLITGLDLPAGIAAPTNSTWALAGNGNYSPAADWTNGTANSPGSVAIFGSSITAPSMVTVDVTGITAGELDFNNANAYTISGDGITLDNGGIAAVLDDINGSHSIQTPLTLVDGLAVTVANAGNTLTLSGAVTGTGPLTMAGAGTLAMTVSNSYSGATTVTAGQLNVTGSITNSNAINVNATSAAASLVLNGADAVSSTAPITATGVSSAITVNASQALDTITSAGNVTFSAGASTVGTIDGTGTLTVGTGSATSLAATYIRQGTLNIGSGATVSINDSVSGPGNANTVSVVQSINDSGTLNLRNNDLIVTNTTQFSAVQSAITNAYNGGAWNQTGITSSSAKTTANVYGLGYAQVGSGAGSLNVSSFDGQTVASGATLVKYTLLGDALLTGTVALSDYNVIIANLNTGTLWTQGAFHPGSNTGLGDYNDVLANFNQTATGSVAVGPALKTAPSSFSPDAATDLKLEVNTVTGDVYALATATTALTGYDIFDKSGNLLDSGDPNTDLNERLLSVPSSTTLGNQTTFRNATNYKLWATILDNTSTLAEGSNNGKLKQGTASTYDTINIPSSGTIDFGDIYSTVAHNNDITFAFSEADPTNAGNPVTGSTYNGEVDYVGNAVMPEPGMLGLLGLGGIMMMRRRRVR